MNIVGAEAAEGRISPTSALEGGNGSQTKPEVDFKNYDELIKMVDDRFIEFYGYFRA